MSRLEIYSPEGLRADGRRWNELRQFNSKINTHSLVADGSSYLEQGNTKVICTVVGPAEPVSRANLSSEEAKLTVELKEMALAIRNAFKQNLLLGLYPRSQITINLNVLSYDGGLLASCINASTLALIDAGIPMYDYLSAITVGLYDNTTPLLDLNTVEENDVSFVTLGIVGKTDKVNVLVVENRVPLDKLELLLENGVTGCHAIRDMMDEEVRRHGLRRLEKKSTRR